MIALLALAAATPAVAAHHPTAAPASDPVVALVAEGENGACLPGRTLCFQLQPIEGTTDMALYVRSGSDSTDQPRIYPFPGASDDTAMSYTLWPSAIRTLVDGESVWLIGIVERVSTMYSGGGGSASRLRLYQLPRSGQGALTDDLLSVPIAGSMLIRACFSEEDMRRRLDACHDDYTFSATITAAGDDGAPLPALTYRTSATAYPRTARRSDDNSERPLRRSDLVRWSDPACSYTRILHYNRATLRYEMDRPAPDCSAYTVP